MRPAGLTLALSLGAALLAAGPADGRLPAGERALLPQEMKYTVRGPAHAPAVVPIHGAGNDQSTFASVANALASRYRVVTYDQRGHGGTRALGADYSSALLAQDLKALHDHLKLGKMHLVGHSFGGRTAVRYAALFPHDVSSVLVEDMDMSSRGPLTPAIKAQLAARGNPQELYGYQASSEDLCTALRCVRSPILFMQADQRLGSAMSPQGLARLRVTRPDALWLAVPGASHSIHGSQPQRFLQALDQHLRASAR